MSNELYHFVQGEPQQGISQRFGEVMNPTEGSLRFKLPLANTKEIEAAIQLADKAFVAWAQLSVLKRSRVFFRWLRLLEEHTEELAQLICLEHGKVINDARGEVQRGLEHVEFSCGIPHLLKGEFSDGVSTAVDMYSMRKPLGVVGCITPFNFPVMVALWMVANALACGNAVLLKPSEKDPSSSIKLAELFIEAGGPPGVFNVLNGDKEAVDGLLQHPLVRAISFVGSTPIARYVYTEAAKGGKRCQAMGGAKNHLVVMPDADMDAVAKALMGAGYGSAGERCMAISVAVAAGAQVAEQISEALMPKLQALKIGPSLEESSEMGPLVTAAHRQRVSGYLDLAEKEGAQLLIDGRGFSLPSHPHGFFLGGSLLDKVTPNMQSYQEEIFGPVLQITRAQSFEEALKLPNQHPYGNGASIFTKDGRIARAFVNQVQAGMVGVNIPIPVPLAFYSFGGWKDSALGDHNQHGMEGIRFFTKNKVVTTRWQDNFPKDSQFSMPTLS